MSVTLDMGMLDDLSIDELRWLEASEILEFPTSPLQHTDFNDSNAVAPWTQCLQDMQRQGSAPKRQLTRSSKRIQRSPQAPPQNTTFSSYDSSPSSTFTPPKESSSPSISSPPTPPLTPSHRRSPRPKLQDSPPEWIYRRPRNPITPRGSPGVPSALSSALTIHQLPSSKSLALTQSLSSTRHNANLPPSMPKLGDERDRKSSNSRDKGAFWSSGLRPRSRSMRSIPLLKTIPSQLEVTYQPTVNENGSSDAGSSQSSSSGAPIAHDVIGTMRAPSISSTLSSASSHSSSRLETPVSPADSIGFHKRNSGYHRRYTSNPNHPNKHLTHPLASSCPNKSILTRASSVSTKDSASAASKSVKFAEVPTVHYASAGYWDSGARDRKDLGTPEPSMDDMGMDVDTMDVDFKSPLRRNVFREVPYREKPRSYAPTSAVARKGSDESEAPEPPTPSNESGHGGLSLKRFMNLGNRKTKPFLPPISTSLPTTPTISRPSISGPYALGSHPLPPTPSSPTHSTTSLRSNMSRSSRTSKSSAKSSKGPRSLFSFSSVHPTSGISNLYGTGVSSLEGYRNTDNPATRSVRSLASVKSGATTPTTGFKSWLSRFGTSRSSN